MLQTRARSFNVLRVLQAVPRRATVGHGLNTCADVARRIVPIPTRTKLTPSLAFHSSSHRLNDPSVNANPLGETSFSDPERPDLYYHLIRPPTPVSRIQPAFALSFLPTPPKIVDSSTIIGWLPAVQEEQGNGEEAGLNDFKENGELSKLC